MSELGFIQRGKRIYDMLANDLSKQVYLNRINYLIFGDYRFVEKYVSLCHPDYPVQVKCAHPDFMDGIPAKAKVLFWGTGRFAEKIIPFLRDEERTVYFCGKDGECGNFYGFKRVKKQQISKSEDLYIIPCTTKYFYEVMEKIMALGIERDHIIDVRKWFFCGTGDEYFYDDFLNFQDNEVFIDAGCCALESSVDFYKKWKKIHKIYAFEPDANNYEVCKKKYEAIKNDFPETVLFPYGTWDGMDELHFNVTHDGSARIGEGETTIKTIAIDEGDRITYIKMDVEGAELRSLQGAKKTILRDRLKLAICIYHKPEDMLALPEFILDLNMDFKLYIRSHSNAENEVVMYAV